MGSIFGTSIRRDLKSVYDTLQSSDAELSLLVTVVKLPTGAHEIITNTEKLHEKVNYLLNTYDDNMCLNANSEVSIEGLLVTWKDEKVLSEYLDELYK